MSQLFNDQTATLKNAVRTLKSENTALRQKLAAAMQQVKSPQPAAPVASTEEAEHQHSSKQQKTLIEAQKSEISRLKRELEKSRSLVETLHKEYSEKAQAVETERGQAEGKLIEKLRQLDKRLKNKEAKLEAAEAELGTLRSSLASSSARTVPAAMAVADPSAEAATSIQSVTEQSARVERLEALLGYLRTTISALDNNNSPPPPLPTVTSQRRGKAVAGTKRTRSAETDCTSAASMGITTHEASQHPPPPPLRRDGGAESPSGASTVPVTALTSAAPNAPKRRGRPPGSGTKKSLPVGTNIVPGASLKLEERQPTRPPITITKMSAEDFVGTGDGGIAYGGATLIGGVEVSFGPTTDGIGAITELVAATRRLGGGDAATSPHAKALAAALHAHFKGDTKLLSQRIVAYIAATFSCPFRASVTMGVRALTTFVNIIASLGVGELLIRDLTKAALRVMGEESASAIDHSHQMVAFGHAIRLVSNQLGNLSSTASRSIAGTALNRLEAETYAVLPLVAAYDCVVAYLHTRNRERSNAHMSHAFSQLLAFVGSLLIKVEIASPNVAGSSSSSPTTTSAAPLALAVQYTIASAMREWQNTQHQQQSPRLVPDGSSLSSASVTRDTSAAVALASLYQDVCEASQWSGQEAPGGLPRLLATMLRNMHHSHHSTSPASTNAIITTSTAATSKGILGSSNNSNGGGSSDALSASSLLNDRDWGLCSEPYKIFLLSARLISLACGFSVSYERVLNSAGGMGGSDDEDAFRDSSTIELIALIVGDFGILEDGATIGDVSAATTSSSVVGLFKDFLTSTSSSSTSNSSNAPCYCVVSAQSRICALLLDSHSGGNNNHEDDGGSSLLLGSTIGRTFGLHGLPTRVQLSIDALNR